MSTGVNCTVLVDGIRAPDGSNPADADTIVILENLSVAWGRADTMTQPDAETCTFDILDSAASGFTNQFRTGSRIDVLARGQVPGTEALPTFTNSGFELASVTWATVNGTAARSGQRVQTGAQALTFVPDDRSAAAAVVLAPSTFEAAGANPDAWDSIPTTELGQTWHLAVSLWIPTGATVEVRPALFTGPYADAWGAAPIAARTYVGNDAWQLVTFDYLVTHQTNFWLGIELRLFPSGPAWDELPPAMTWNDVDPSRTWNDYGTVYVDDAQVTSPSEPAGSTVLVFSGRVTDLSSQWDESAGAPVVSVTASGFTADLENRRVGDEPWNVETVDARAHRILDEAGLPITIDIDTSIDGTLLSWRDVDSQGALGLLKSIAVSVDGVLWPAVHSALGAYLRLEDPAMRTSLLQLADEAGPPATIVHRNILTNPDVEAFGAAATQRTNRATDPRATRLTVAGGALGWAPRWFGSAPGAGTSVLVTGAADGPLPGIATYIRRTWTVAPPGGSAGDVGFVHTNEYGTTGTHTTGKPVTAGTSYTFSSYIRSSRAVPASASWGLRVVWRDAAGAYLSTSAGTFAALPAAAWLRLVYTVTAPAGAAFVELLSSNGAAPMTGITAGDTLDGTALLMEAAPGSVLPYFDGATPAAGDFTYAWTGTAHASISVQQAAPATGAAGQAGYALVNSSTEWAARGARSLRIYPVRSNGDTFADLTMIGKSPATLQGKTVTLLGTVRLTAPSTGTLSPNARSFRVAVKNGAAVQTELTASIVWLSTAPNVAGVHEVRGTVVIPADAETWGFVRLYHGGSVGSEPVWWDQIAVIEGEYLGPYFDGRTPSTSAFTYAWAGAADASMSTMTSVQTHTIVIEESDPDAGIDVSACSILRNSVTWAQSVADVITRVSASWKLQGVDDEGNNTTSDVTELVVDAELEGIHGTRAASVTTELQASADAIDVAQRILSRTSPDSWRAEGLAIDDDDVNPDAAGVALMLTLLDGTSRIGAPLILGELPTWSPGGATSGVYLEGGTYSYVGGRWILQLNVSSGGSGLGESAAWDEMQASWTWDQWDPQLSWDDLRGVAAPQ